MLEQFFSLLKRYILPYLQIFDMGIDTELFCQPV